MAQEVNINAYTSLAEWIKNVKTYPPAEIFFEAYGKAAKAEDRIKDVCEELYRFCYPENQKNILGDLGASWRELEVLYIMGIEGIKPEHTKAVSDRFLQDAKAACTAMEAMFKKDQLLQQYYTPWKKKFSEISTMVYELTK